MNTFPVLTAFGTWPGSPQSTTENDDNFMTFMRELQPSLTQNIRHLSNLVHSLWERTSNAWGSSAPLSVSTAGDHRATLHYVAWQTVEHSHRATSIRSCSLATSTVYCSRIRARYSWKRCGSKCKNHRAQIFIYRHHPKSELDISEIPKKWYTRVKNNFAGSLASVSSQVGEISAHVS